MTKSPAFYAAARDAVVQYARKQARLPEFKSKQPRGYVPWAPFGHPRDDPPVVRVLTCGAVGGDVLPRDTWLTLLPFEDIRPTTPADTKRELLTKRVNFMRLLGRLAESPDFQFYPGINCVNVDTERPHESFWLELLRKLAPDTVDDMSKELERNFAALSQGGKMRVLISVETNLRQAGVADTLGLFFQALCAGDDGNDEEYRKVEDACGLKKGSAARPMEIGLEFVSGKLNQAAMMEILDGISSLSGSSAFGFSTLRFGPECPLSPSTATELGERLSQLKLDTLQLGHTTNVRPISLRQTVMAVAASVNRVVMTDRDKSIGAIASALRGSGESVQELDLECSTNADLAAWLAYSVFHVDSRAKVSSLCIRMAEGSPWLTSECVERFKRALRRSSMGQTDDKMLAIDEAKPLIRNFVKLQATATIKFAPYEGKKTVLKLTEEDVKVPFEVLEENVSEVEVLVPGIGIGLAAAAAIRERFTEPSQLNDDRASNPINRTVTSFTLRGFEPRTRYRSRFASTSPALLVELLSIIGEPLEQLSLPGMDLTNTHIEQILQHCPNLIKLNISHNYACDLSPFLDACYIRPSKLKTLSLLQWHTMHENPPVVQQLNRWLTTRSPLKLGQLAVCVVPRSRSFQDQAAYAEAHIQPLISALISWGGLEYVEVQVSYSDARMLPTDLKTPTSSHANLAVRHKLAFLSVVQQHHTSAIGSLDAAVVRQIFQFCGRRRTFIIWS